VVQSATLRLFSDSSRAGRSIQALQLNAAWTESGVTWANQPVTTGTAATTTSGTGYRQWNVTSQVQAMFAAGANHGFLIRDAVEGNSGAEQSFHSREKGSSLPELVVTFSSPSGAPATTATATPTVAATTTSVATATATSAAAACVATTVTVSANADAWIDQASASSNKGGDSILKVQGKGSNNFRALARFAQPASIPTGCVVESATLRLYAASSTSGRTLQALRINANWTENGVTWANQPATTGTAVTTASGSGTAYREWNVTGQVQAMYAANANHGFLIRDASESGGGWEQQFHSKEKGETMPQLVIRFAPAAGGGGGASLLAANGEQPAMAPSALPTAEPAFRMYLPLIHR
jgi:hypothetical protein